MICTASSAAFFPPSTATAVQLLVDGCAPGFRVIIDLPLGGGS